MRWLYAASVVAIMTISVPVKGAEGYIEPSDVIFEMKPVARVFPVSPDDKDYGKTFPVICGVTDTGRLEDCHTDDATIDNKAYVASVIRELEVFTISTTDKEGRKTAGRQIRFVMKVGSGELLSM